MRYVKKIPPTDKELGNKLLSEGWAKLKEPSNIVTATLLSIPFVFINGAISIIILFYLYSPLREFITNFNGFTITITINLYIFIYLALFLLFMIAHEFLHACFIPNVLNSNKTCWGITGFYAFVFTTEKIKKGRFIIISIMPFIILSIILPFLLYLLGWLNCVTFLLCFINAMGSSVDCLNLLLVITQVPNGSEIVMNGFETYYKKIESLY